MDRAAEVASSLRGPDAGRPADLGGGLALLNAPPAPFVPERSTAPDRGAHRPVDGRPGSGHGASPRCARSLPHSTRCGPDPVRGAAGHVRVARAVHGPHPWPGRLPDRCPRRRRARRASRAQARSPGQPPLQPLGGAFARMAEGDAARTARRPLGVAGGGRLVRSRPDDAVRTWASGLRAALEPWSRGEPYPNFMPDRDVAACARLRPGDLGAAPGHPRRLGPRRRARRRPRDPLAQPVAAGVA